MTFHAMAKEDPLRRHNDVDLWPSESHDPNATWSPVSDWVEGSNWTTTSSKYDVLHDCGPSEYLFLFYAYYYGLMMLVTIIGVAGNTAVIR